MIVVQGKGASGGVVSGPLYFYRRAATAYAKTSARGPAAEAARFAAAQRQAIDELGTLAEKARAENGDEIALLFETHAMFVEDEDFTGAVRAALEQQNASAEHAVQLAGEQMAAVFTAMDDEYMQARAADVRDVARRILNILTGAAAGGIETDVPVILAADDLAPSETVQLDKSKILGFATKEGSANSHTAILARTMGIPAVCALGTELTPQYHGRMAYLDGSAGQLTLDPDPDTLAALRAKEQALAARRELLKTMVGQKDITKDGRELTVCCNIGSPEDVAAVLENDGQGIGLFRSEFLYLAAADYPGEEAQFEAYRTVAAAMQGKRVIIRTLDIGADKQAEYFHLEKEPNPALGMRAVRLCLTRPEVFRTQLRALYRASAYGKVAILFPMITSLWEVQACKHACRQVMAELRAEGIPYNAETELGIMIETPAAVLMADELAREVDFFSVGTNDLTQYTLACDRQASNLGRFFDPHHPAVLRALKMAADAAHAAGIWIGICGELGADPDLLETFLAIGIDELSVTPNAVLPLRARIRQCTAADCTLDRLNV